MNYRDKLYSEYVSTHTSQLYGEADLKAIKKQFPVWKKYYGKGLPESKEGNILDIGCGNGGFVYWLQELGYKNTSGIDISDEQIELAKKLGITDIHKAGLKEYLKDKKEVYDTIFARDVIEHLRKEEIMDVMKLIHNSLSINGKFIIKSPNADGPFFGRYRYGDFTHEIAFTRSSLSQILRAIGFRKIEFYPTGPVVHGVKSFIRYVLWKIMELFLKFYLLVESGGGKGVFTQTLIGIAEK